MNEQPGFERLLRFVLLLAGNRNYTLAEIAERIEVTERTVYRYIDTLRNEGFIISNENGSYRLDKDSPYLKDIKDLLHFTPEESWILNRAILAIDDAVPIKQNLAKKLYAIYDLKNIPYPVIHKEQSERIVTLINAIESKRCVNFRDYHSPNSNTVGDRQVEPYEFTLNYGYVWCYDIKDQRNKTFKTARIGKVEIINEDWKYEDRHEPVMMDIFRVSGKKTQKVILDMSMRAASLLTEEFPMSEDFLESSGNSRYRFTGEVCSYEGIGRFVLGLMDEIEVKSPASFRNYLNDKIKNKIFK